MVQLEERLGMIPPHKVLEWQECKKQRALLDDMITGLQRLLQ